jgi:hypothetical protein
LTKISGYEYYAFSDQDDIWNESKILTSLEVLNHEKSELVMTARELIDVDNKLINSNLNKKIIPGWNNALVENVAYGNTILINQFARNKILRFLPQGILHFDSWIYLFISTTGKMSYISKPLVMYRIHSNNQIGIRKSFSIKNLIRNLNQFDFQNRALIRLAKDLLEPEKLTLIEKHVGLCSSNNPFAFIFDSNRTFYRQKRIDNFIFKFILPFTGKEV